MMNTLVYVVTGNTNFTSINVHHWCSRLSFLVSIIIEQVELECVGYKMCDIIISKFVMITIDRHKYTSHQFRQSGQAGRLEDTEPIDTIGNF